MKGIKDISDDDAVEVAKIAARRPDHYTIDEADITRHKDAVNVIFLDKIDEVINIAFNGDVLVFRWVDANHKIIEQRSYNQAKYIDFLRSKSYEI